MERFLRWILNAGYLSSPRCSYTVVSRTHTLHFCFHLAVSSSLESPALPFLGRMDRTSNTSPALPNSDSAAVPHATELSLNATRGQPSVTAMMRACVLNRRTSFTSSPIISSSVPVDMAGAHERCFHAECIGTLKPMSEEVRVLLLRQEETQARITATRKPQQLRRALILPKRPRGQQIFQQWIAGRPNRPQTPTHTRPSHSSSRAGINGHSLPSRMDAVAPPCHCNIHHRTVSTHSYRIKPTGR